RGADGATYIFGKNGSTLAAAADAAGGGIWSNGALTLQHLTLPGGGTIHSLLQSNTAQGGTGGFFFSSNGWTPVNGGHAFGGALYGAGGTANLANADLANNMARGGTGGGGGNQYEVAYGGNGGAAFGGAVDVAAGSVAMSGLVVESNQAQGGAGGWGLNPI